MHRDLLALIETAGDLATLPSTVLRLLGVLRDPAVSAHEVRAILEPDPAMTSNLLKLANSAYYGHRRKVRTVQEALVLLGNRATATLAFTTAMTPILRQDLELYGLDRDDYWAHAVLTAQAAAFLIRTDARRIDSGVAYTAGLIHDVGKLLVTTGARRCGWRLEEAALADGREREVLGFDHAEAGAALTELWDLPEDLIDPVRCHHEPGAVEDATGVVRAVAGANLLAHHVLALEGGLDGVATADPSPQEELEVACSRLLAELGYESDIMRRFRQERADNADLTDILVPSPA